MISVSIASSRRLAVLNRRLDFVGTQASAGMLAMIPSGISSASSTCSRLSISPICSATHALGQEGPGQHGERERPHLAVEGEGLAVGPGVDAGHRDIAHRGQVTGGDLPAMERGLHQPPLPAMVIAVRHHQPVADEGFGPAEADALLQLPGLADQRLPDRGRAVQQVHRERPETDADHIAEIPPALQQPERIAAELQRVPEHAPSAGQQGNLRPDRLTGDGQVPHPFPNA